MTKCEKAYGVKTPEQQGCPAIATINEATVKCQKAYAHHGVHEAVGRLSGQEYDDYEIPIVVRWKRHIDDEEEPSVATRSERLAADRAVYDERKK